VDAQELLVQHRREGQRAERLGARVVDALRVLVLAYTTRPSASRARERRAHENAARTFELEGEVVRQVAALVVPPQQEDARRVPYLEGPQVQHALAHTRGISGA
jgi:hypothetical protein